MEQSTLISILKVFFMILFFAIVSFVGTLPIRSKAFKSNPKLRIFGATFAGALFINVAILHILPEESDALEEYLRDGQKTQDGDDIEVFPLANLIMMVGFLITIFFTKVMIKHEHFHDHDDHSHDEKDHKHIEHHDHSKQNDHVHRDTPIVRKQNEENRLDESLLTQNEIKEIKKAEKKKSSLNEAYVLTIAIYFHTIFEGIAIGVQSSLTEFLSIAVAIAFHKWADALSMGCHYKARHIPKKRSIQLIIGQAVLNVVSIGVGWIISMEGDVLQAIFLSLSAGTFLAISTMQLLSEQLHHREYPYQKFGLLILSTLFISSIWFVENSLF